MKKTVIPKRLPTPTPPDSAIREYYKNLRRYSSRYIELVRFALKEAISDLKSVAAQEQLVVRKDSVERFDTDINKRVNDLFDWVNRELNSAFTDQVLRSWAKSMIHNTNKTSKRNVTKVTESVDLDIEPLLHDKDLNPFFQNVIDENVGLIKSIPAYKQATFKTQLVYAISNDMPMDQIQKIIAKHIGSSGDVNGRARFIARDQIGKLNGKLNKYRQQQLGGKTYFWKGTKDSRERTEHLKLEGARFLWDKNYEVDKNGKKIPGGRVKPGKSHNLNPGEDYQCRCHAEMDVENILE